jgi:hypothetical protein
VAGVVKCNAPSEKARLQRSIERAAKLGKRWKRKNGAKGPDLIGDSIRRRERDMANALTQLDDAGKAWKRELELVDGYEYEFDKRKSDLARCVQLTTSTAEPLKNQA